MPFAINTIKKSSPLGGWGVVLFLFLFLILLFTSCYRDSSTINEQEEAHDALATGDTLTQEQQDSISFYSTHHFTEGYNFEVYKDSISLLVQQPEEMVSQMEIDTFAVYKNHHVVVGDIRDDGDGFTKRNYCQRLCLLILSLRLSCSSPTRTSSSR